MTTIEDYIKAIEAMGHMRTWWIFGFEWWGAAKPYRMWTRAGQCYMPLVLGMWIRCNEQHHLETTRRKEKTARQSRGEVTPKGAERSEAAAKRLDEPGGVL